MLALQAYEDLACAGCGGLLSDTTAEGAEDGYRVPPPTRCHRCTAIGQASEDYRETNQPQALLYRVERR
jgi:hypothetical protein